MSQVGYVMCALLLAMGCQANAPADVSDARGEGHVDAAMVDAGTDVARDAETVSEEDASIEGGTAGEAPCGANQGTFVELGGDYQHDRLEMYCETLGGGSFSGPSAIVGSDLVMGACGGGHTWTLMPRQDGSGTAVVYYQGANGLERNSSSVANATVLFSAAPEPQARVVGTILEGTFDATFIGDDASVRHLVGSFRVCLASIVGPQP